MKHNNLYGDTNSDLLKLFSDAGDRRHLMCVPMDFAKRTHLVCFCNGLGDVLKKPFAVKNSKAGIDFLFEQLQTTCQRRAIDPKHVFFGGEDLPAFAENFIHDIRARGYAFASVNAFEAKRLRDNFQSSNDHLDLRGIGKALLLNRGNFNSGCQMNAYRNLRELHRTRRRHVRDQTAVGNRIHPHVDRLFPGFLDASRSGISPFGPASIWLMKQRFSAAQLLKRRPDSLADHLSQRGIQNAQQAVNQLRELASSALAPSPDHLIVWQTALQRELSLYECLQTNIDTITRQMAYWLAQTSGALLTSVGGIGVTLASAITAELGQPDRLRRLACLCSYAGIVPSSKQSGGPEHAPLTKHVKPRCNRILKDYLVQASVKLGQWGPPDLKSQFHHMEANHQHAAFAMAKKLLRLIKCLMRTECVYRPKSLMGTDTPKQELADYYRSLWPELVAKWRGKADLRHVFAQHHPLGAWRQMVQEAYGLKLVLPAQRI